MPRPEIPKSRGGGHEPATAPKLGRSTTDGNEVLRVSPGKPRNIIASPRVWPFTLAGMVSRFLSLLFDWLVSNSTSTNQAPLVANRRISGSNSGPTFFCRSGTS